MSAPIDIDSHADKFLQYIDSSPTKFHAVQVLIDMLLDQGYTRLYEDQDWTSVLVTGRRYFVTRNASSIIAFNIGGLYTIPGPIAMICTHLDAITWKVKPVSDQVEHGFRLLKVAPYGVAGGQTWLDRDLGLAGRVIMKNKGRLVQRLVRLPFPVAKIPTLAEHFGDTSQPPFNQETQLTPIVGLSRLPDHDKQTETATPSLNMLSRNHAPELLDAIASELEIRVEDIVDIEMELYDFQAASRLGLDGELLSVPRCDDKLCTYSAIHGLLSQIKIETSKQISLVASFDAEEVGSLLRQGAGSNFLPLVIERVIESLNPGYGSRNLFGAIMAQSFLISADVEHAVNPNFLDNYGLRPWLNTGPVLCCDSNANVTTDGISAALMQLIAGRSGIPLQLSQIRNGEPSGGTIGPTLSSMLGVRSCDLGIVQLGMHSIRGTTGSRDPGLGAAFYSAYFEHFVDICNPI